MSDTPLRLELNAEAATVGEEIKGKVTGDPAAMPRPGATVSVELLWRTSGECQSEERVVAQEKLSLQGAPPASFSLRVPGAGPMTYAGRAFAIDWFVRLTPERAIEAPLTVVAARKRAAPL